MTHWLEITRGEAPLIVCFPHGGTTIPQGIETRLASPWLGRKDTDWHIAELYDFVSDLGATTIATTISRTVIDCNRDPSGASLYPGQVTTGLCPLETFDGEPLYRADSPDEAEIAQRRKSWFDPYHAAIQAEIERLRAAHERIVLYDAHSIRSHVPRLFDGELPQFNIGTNGGTSCSPALRETVAAICADSGMSHVVDGRFRGGWTTRHYGNPENGVHAIQMELAMRGYLATEKSKSESRTAHPELVEGCRTARSTGVLRQAQNEWGLCEFPAGRSVEPEVPTPANWPAPLSGAPAVLPTLRRVIGACLDFAKG